MRCYLSNYDCSALYSIIVFVHAPKTAFFKLKPAPKPGINSNKDYSY